MNPFCFEIHQEFHMFSLIPVFQIYRKNVYNLVTVFNFGEKTCVNTDSI